jgi:hypothetical protein
MRPVLPRNTLHFDVLRRESIANSDLCDCEVRNRAIIAEHTPDYAETWVIYNDGTRRNVEQPRNVLRQAPRSAVR